MTNEQVYIGPGQPCVISSASAINASNRLYEGNQEGWTAWRPAKTKKPHYVSCWRTQWAVLYWCDP